MWSQNHTRSFWPFSLRPQISLLNPSPRSLLKCLSVLSRLWRRYLYPRPLFPTPTSTKFAPLVHLLPPGVLKLRSSFWRSSLPFLAGTKMIGQIVRTLLMVPTETAGLPEVIALLQSRGWSNVLLPSWLWWGWYLNPTGSCVFWLEEKSWMQFRDSQWRCLLFLFL